MKLFAAAGVGKISETPVGVGWERTKNSNLYRTLTPMAESKQSCS